MPARPDSALALLSATLTAAAAGVLGIEFALPGGARALCLEAIFTYGSGGTSAKAWVQTTLDGGTTWFDIASFAFTTSSAKKLSTVHLTTALTPATVPTDGTLTDDTILNGVLGNRLRIKFSSVGIYAGSTVLAINAVAKG